jgi:hypothetical protein
MAKPLGMNFEIYTGYFDGFDFQRTIQKVHPNFNRLKNRNPSVEKYLLFDNWQDSPYILFTGFVSDPKLLDSSYINDYPNVLCAVVSNSRKMAYEAVRNFSAVTRIELDELNEVNINEPIATQINRKRVGKKIEEHLNPFLSYYAPELVS